MKAHCGLRCLKFEKLIFQESEDVYAGILSKDCFEHYIKGVDLVFHDLLNSNPLVGNFFDDKIKSNLVSLFIRKLNKQHETFKHGLLLYNEEVFMTLDPNTIRDRVEIYDPIRGRILLKIFGFRFEERPLTSLPYMKYMPEEHKITLETEDQIADVADTEQKNKIIADNLKLIFRPYQYDTTDLESTDSEGNPFKLR